MRFRRMRYLTFFLAAMFFASNAIGAVRAYVVQPTGQEHAAVRALDAEGDTHPCQQSDDAARCLTHCTQIYTNHEQQFWPRFRPLVFTRTRRFPRSDPADAEAGCSALAPHIVGPPLTILFGNFRN